MNIFISGASAGIGAELAKLYSQEKTNIYIIANSRIDLLADISKHCKFKKANVVYRSADVRNFDQMKEIAEDFYKSFGNVDLLIANAGIAESSNEKTPEILLARNNMETNYFGVIHTIEAFLPQMKKQKTGQIVVISSLASRLITRRSGAYSASKSAINSWTTALRLQLKQFGIHVSILNPGFVDTSMTKENSHFMPGLISAELAAVKIKRYVDKKVRSRYFPFMAKLISLFLQILPKFIFEKAFLILEKYIGHHSYRKNHNQVSN